MQFGTFDNCRGCDQAMSSVPGQQGGSQAELPAKHPSVNLQDGKCRVEDDGCSSRSLPEGSKHLSNPTN